MSHDYVVYRAKTSAGEEIEVVSNGYIKVMAEKEVPPRLEFSWETGKKPDVDAIARWLPYEKAEQHPKPSQLAHEDQGDSV